MKFWPELDDMGNVMKVKLWEPLRDILFPQCCLACNIRLSGHGVVSFCQTCLEEVRLISEPFCSSCGKPFLKSAGGNHLCSNCLKGEYHFSRARAAVYYQGPIVEAVKEFKYNGRMHGLETFASIVSLHHKYYPFSEPEIIIPVPLHPARLKKRGFNQALVLCRRFFPHLKKKIEPFVLERQKKTESQTGKSSVERHRNVRGAFGVKKTDKLRGKNVLLVDDVFTTGATVNECAKILLKNRASEVEVFTFARVEG
jgi:ComF family protein